MGPVFVCTTDSKWAFPSLVLIRSGCETELPFNIVSPFQRRKGACNGHSHLLGSFLYRIGRIENPSCSACGHSSQDTSHLILHCSATDSLRRSLFRRLSVSLRSLIQTLGRFPASGAPWSSAMPPSLGRGRVINNNNKRRGTSTHVSTRACL